MYDKALSVLIDKFGELEEDTLEYDFDLTDYDEREMGTKLKKKVLVFKELVERTELPDIKLFTNKIEDDSAVDENRKINLDPGYMTAHHLILATAKEMPWKIYLDKGIFGDLTYMFKKDQCVLLDKTFPDFRKKEVQEFFIKLRKKFMRDLSAA